LILDGCKLNENNKKKKKYVMNILEKKIKDQINITDAYNLYGFNLTQIVDVELILSTYFGNLRLFPRGKMSSNKSIRYRQVL